MKELNEKIVNFDELHQYQENINDNNEINEWINKYLQPIISMMGSKTTWNLFPKIESSGFTGNTPKK